MCIRDRLVGLLVSVLLSFLLAKTMIDPIEKLTEGAERIATGDFDETLAVESTDEIGVLTTTFNDMASVLHSTLEAVENERNKLDTLFLHMSAVSYTHLDVYKRQRPHRSTKNGSRSARSRNPCIPKPPS